MGGGFEGENFPEMADHNNREAGGSIYRALK
jgi:hypothetical protein